MKVTQTQTTTSFEGSTEKILAVFGDKLDLSSLSQQEPAGLPQEQPIAMTETFEETVTEIEAPAPAPEILETIEEPEAEVEPIAEPNEDGEVTLELPALVEA